MIFWRILEKEIWKIADYFQGLSSALSWNSFKDICTSLKCCMWDVCTESSTHSTLPPHQDSPPFLSSADIFICVPATSLLFFIHSSVFVLSCVLWGCDVWVSDAQLSRICHLDLVSLSSWYLAFWFPHHWFLFFYSSGVRCVYKASGKLLCDLQFLVHKYNFEEENKSDLNLRLPPLAACRM